MKRVLIVCTANKARSPMAMAIANKIAEKKSAKYSFSSAGLTVIGHEIDENVHTVLEEVGIFTNHTPMGIIELDISKFDAIHVMTQRQKITVMSLFKHIPDLDDKITVLGIENPYFLGLDAYRDCRDKLTAFYENYING